MFNVVLVPGGFPSLCAILLFPLTFSWLICYCHLWLSFSPGNWLSDNRYLTDIELPSPFGKLT